MENENINVALILKLKVQTEFIGLPMFLFNSLFGECVLKSVTDGCIEVKAACDFTKDGRTMCLDQTGRFSPKGDPVLFPSKFMRDWSKFAWTEGTILKGDYWVRLENQTYECVCGYCFFDAFSDDTYTEVSAYAYVPIGRGLEKQDWEDLDTDTLVEVTDRDELFMALLALQGYPISKQINDEVLKSGKYDEVLQKVIEEQSRCNDLKDVLYRFPGNSRNNSSTSEPLENLVSNKTLLESKEMGEEENKEYK